MGRLENFSKQISGGTLTRDLRVKDVPPCVREGTSSNADKGRQGEVASATSGHPFQCGLICAGRYRKVQAEKAASAGSKMFHRKLAVQQKITTYNTQSILNK